MKPILVGVLILTAIICRGADPVSELKSFADFKEVNLEKLRGGEILAQRGSLMDFSRGISVQTCYIAKASPDKVAATYPVWDPSKKEILKVFYHCPIQSQVSDDDFKPLNLNSEKSPIRRLVEETRSTTGDKTSLQLSCTEAKRLAEWVKANSGKIEDLTRGWAALLKDRAWRFQKEGLGSSSMYEKDGSVIQVASEFQSLLKEDPDIAKRFSSLIQDTPLGGANPPLLEPHYYWELLDADGHAVFNLGAIYIKPFEGHFQVLDCTYYSSGGFYVSFTLRELWPVMIDNQQATLVWRGDFLSAPSVALAKGIDRMAFGSIMLQDVKKAVRCFQQDLAKGL